MNKFLRTTAILSTLALVSAGAYSLNRETYRKGQASVKPQIEQTQTELQTQLNQAQIDLANKVAENNQLKAEVNTLITQRDEAIASGEASEEKVSNLNAQIDTYQATITQNETAITALNVKVTKMNSIVAKTVTEVEAEDLEDFTEVSSYMFAGCTQLTDVTIPDNITSIGSNAFEGCTSLTDITMQATTPPTLANTNAIPSGVNINIPDNSREAYQSATNWSDLSSQLVGDEEVVETVTYEGLEFDGQTLTSYSGTATDVVIPSSYSIQLITEDVKGILISTSALSNFDEYSYGSLEFETLDGTVITKSGENLASLADEYAQLYINKCTDVMSFNMIEIIDNATYPLYCNNQKFNSAMDFEDYIMLNSIDEFNFAGQMELPNYVEGSDYIVTVIGERAFADCADITSIKLPSTLKSINDCAFQFCKGLTSIVIPEGVESLGIGAFQSCSNLKKVTLPSTLIYVGAICFDQCYNLSYTTYENGRYLGNDNNPYLVLASGANTASFSIHDETRHILSSAFSYFTALTSINLPNNLLTIGNSAFYGCTSLSNVVLPSSLTYIGNGTFDSCTGLTSITIPDSVTYIGTAFLNCSNLELVVFEDTVTTWNVGSVSDLSVADSSQNAIYLTDTHKYDIWTKN